MPIDSTVNTVETSDQLNESSFIQLTDSDGNEVGTPIWIPLDVDRGKLTDLLSSLLQRVSNLFLLSSLLFVYKSLFTQTDASVQSERFMSVCQD